MSVVIKLDFNTALQTEKRVECRFLIVVISKGSSVIKTLSCEDQTLLVGGNPVFGLELIFDIFNGCKALNLESDGL